MEMFLAILGSSVLSSVVTAIFAFIQGRKQDTVKYIGEERTKWREKIREIGEKIEKCRYSGAGEKNIDTYLNQLQMNINTYGKFDKSDYIHDAHIWEVIEVIQNAENEDDFEINKKLLLHYISLMLKEDWERSKDEVKGYSRLLLCILLHIVVYACFGFCYFGILHLEDIQLFLGTVIFNSLFILVVRFGILDEMASQADSRKHFSIKKIHKSEKGFNRKALIIAIVFVVYIVGFFIVLNSLLISAVMQNIRYQISDDRGIVFTNLDERWVLNMDEELEKCFNKKIEISYSEDTIEWDEERNKDTEGIIKGVLVEKIEFFIMIILTILCVEIVFLCFWGSINNIDAKNRRLRPYIIQMKYMICKEYCKEISEAENILEKIMHMDDADWESEGWDELLAVEHRLLKDIHDQLKRKYYKEKLQVDNLKSFESMYIRMEAAESIEDCMQKLKNIAKSRRFFFKKITVSEKKTVVSEIKQCIEELQQKGDIYSAS